MIRGLHLIVGAAEVASPSFQDVLGSLARDFPDRVAVHLRTPGLSARGLLGRARACLRIDGLFTYVNDRVDVAMASGAPGVQLGRASIDASDARTLLGSGAVIGASVHGAGEAADPRTVGADFLLVGTVFASPTHPGRPGQGPALLEAVRSVDPRPLVGIGGISPDRVAVLLDAGAAGIAVHGGVWSVAEPARAAQAYLEILFGDRGVARP